MAWSISQYRVGDLVEVRSKEEILTSLDKQGCFEGMPFMPEMLQFCGKHFRVSAVAHKTCDTIRGTGGRRLQRAVHLALIRCDGSAHGGCQADCSLFWKDMWLKPAVQNRTYAAPTKASAPQTFSDGCTESQLLTSTRLASGAEQVEPRYSCQATKLYEATERLAVWDVRQYVFDVVTRNHSVGRVLRVLWLALLRWFLSRVPFGYRVVKGFSDWMHLSLTGRPSPSLSCEIGNGEPTPTGRLDLKPGEYVRIKSKKKIEQTLDETGRNRGLSFDPDEMVAYCDRVFNVRSSVSKIIDERTGKMLQMKQPCIILEGVVCNAEYARLRLNCPRAIRPYWRELWLERVSDD